jgi:hypothetical protein
VGQRLNKNRNQRYSNAAGVSRNPHAFLFSSTVKQWCRHRSRLSTDSTAHT